MLNVVERFIRYVQVETTSNEASDTVPSTKEQLELAKILVEDMKKIGLENIELDEKGYVYGSLASNVDKKVPTIGFIAHMDTAPDLSGKNVNPQQFVYLGGDILLNEEYTMSLEEFPFLEDLKGKELITTDGTTLLGADDKAGIAEILDAMKYLVENQSIKHGEIKVAFTPDEEIGRGADHFDVAGFNADFAYTMDGGPVGELEYENFNAASIHIEIQGRNVHPGTAKNIMVNSITIANEIENMLPKNERPEYTERYEGFYLLTGIKGSVDKTEMNYIIRDHSLEKFEEKKILIENIVEFLNDKYGHRIDISIKDSYYNMREKIEPYMEIIGLAEKSMKDIGITPNIKPIRGGTDGARLSYMGLPTPNLFTGGYNYHGRFEFIPVDSLKLASALIVKISENLVDYPNEKLK
ncbi:peptidase T [Miniphocaeibacter massiliensis]|uniref:peptidase T n=1 Tax=Miniphocaeibacter massiliensis TaxID=2041841 RepID=UPI000C1C37D1|nr:peptidase T [Miniphocaeibacter massiliensis]